MRKKVLEELYNNKGSYVSGEVLRNKFGVSRTAIWKHINALKAEGYNIETASRKGYTLLEMEDKLLPKEIEMLLSGKAIGHEIIYFDSIGSTNSYAKKEANKLKDGTVILSEEQTTGRGRRGREWSSPKGTGIWMSLVLKPNIPPTEGVRMTQIAAAAVCKSIRQMTSLDALIKWPNDIVVNGKKICGILTEMAGELNEIRYIVVGIGINVNTSSFSDELKNVATSLLIESNSKIDRKKLVVNILENFETLYNAYINGSGFDEALNIVKKYSAILGKEIKIVQGNRETIAKAIDIDREGLLLVEMKDGTRELISSGEISIRGMVGYI